MLGGHVEDDEHLRPLNRLAELLGRASLIVTARLRQEPGNGAKRAHAYHLADKPGQP